MHTYNTQVDNFNKLLTKIRELEQGSQNDLLSEAFKLELEHKEVKIVESRQEVSEAWSIVERVSEHKAVLMATNKELQDELNAYKSFFTSKYDTLERESSSTYQMLVSLKQENNLLAHKIEKVIIENRYLKGCVGKGNSSKITNEKFNKGGNTEVAVQNKIKAHDSNSMNLKFDANVDSLREQLVETKSHELELLAKFEESSSNNKFLNNRNHELRSTIDELTNKMFDLNDQVIKLAEYNAKLRVQASLGPEVLEKLGHNPSSMPGTNKSPMIENVVSSDKASGKIPLHNILKGESDGVNEVLNLLHKNKLLEEELHKTYSKLEELTIFNEQSEAKLHGLVKLQNEIKDVARNSMLDSKGFKDQSTKINSLLLKIKAREIELNILNNERGDVDSLKTELSQCKKVIMTHDIMPDMYDILSKYGDNVPIQMIKSILLTMHHKYIEHVLSLFNQIDELTERAKHASDVSLKSQFYLRSTCAENYKLKSTISKYETDLKEKRKEEMELLERIIGASMKKYHQNETSTPSKTLQVDDHLEKGVKKQSKANTNKKSQKKPSKSPARIKPDEVEKDVVQEQQADTKKIKDLSKPITLESHAAALQRRVYVLRNENDKLKLDFHNSNQNYLEVKDQYMALQEVLHQSMRSNYVQSEVGDQIFKSLRSEFKSTIAKLESIETGDLSIKEYENLITDGKLKNTVSENKRLYEDIQTYLTQAQLQQVQCKAKCDIHELIQLFIISSPTLDKEEINTEKERNLVQKISELENSNKSLRQNLIDTLNDLKTSEKENELMFAEKLKLQKQLGDEYSQANSVMRGTQHSQYIEDQMNEYSEEVNDISANMKDDHEDIDYQEQIKADNDFFNQNKSLLSHTDNMIDKYNSMIKSNLSNTKDMMSLPTNGNIKHLSSGMSSLHKIDELDGEGELKSDKAIESLDYSMSKEEKKMPKTKLNRLNQKLESDLGTNDQHVFNTARTQNEPNANISKVIGIIEDLENDLKQSCHKEQPGSNFFEKRNQTNIGVAKKGKKTKNKKSLLPDVSFEGDTISTSSRVYERKQKTIENDNDDTQAKFRIKTKKSKKGDKAIGGLPPMHTHKKL